MDGAAGADRSAPPSERHRRVREKTRELIEELQKEAPQPAAIPSERTRYDRDHTPQPADANARTESWPHCMTTLIWLLALAALALGLGNIQYHSEVLTGGGSIETSPSVQWFSPFWHAFAVTTIALALAALAASFFMRRRFVGLVFAWILTVFVGARGLSLIVIGYDVNIFGIAIAGLGLLILCTALSILLAGRRVREFVTGTPA